ncbi:helix-turn-helix domain-containing protein [Aequorivita sp. SDUM287046]|uniref:Helix-turn-helix domain-containing protein n=1 Tax=Aequorivita aurantiaca TaxID=3053356 RepID=A0ABT8DIG4_9FLAO|nr:helix-turn-helix domain-containing protein [Aequorivita aurantiaca]MDN3724798.1 helix-turn-helix domain-containing protein [Aequorivita aurantiaca]
MSYFSSVEKWAMFVDFILIAGMALLFLLMVFLFKARTHFSKNLLFVFFANSFFFLLYYYAFLHRLGDLGALAFFFGNGTGYLLGPVTYFYLKALILPKSKILPALWLHLIPFFCNWLFVSLPIAISIATPALTDYGKNYAAIADYLNLVENIYFLVYIIITYKLTQRIRIASLDNYSSLSRTGLSWFHNLLVGLFIIVVLDSLFSVYELNYAMIPWNIGTIIAFLFIVLYCYLGYKGIFQTNLMLPGFVVHEPLQKITDDKNVVTKLNPSGITETESAELKMRLNELLEVEKLYLNENLSLTDLAEAMDISSRKLSEFLNKSLHINFYNLINDYRVNEVQQKLKEDESKKYSLLGLAQDSGFQSKASFNRIFKNKTGMSPSQYRQMYCS